MKLLDSTENKNLKAHLGTELLLIKNKSILIETYINKTLSNDKTSRFAKALSAK